MHSSLLNSDKQTITVETFHSSIALNAKSAALAKKNKYQPGRMAYHHGGSLHGISHFVQRDSSIKRSMRKVSKLAK